MRTSLLIPATLALALSAALPLNAADGTPTSRRDAANQWGQEGMQRVEVTGLDTAFVRPGANLAGYTRVKLAPVDVSFRRDWGQPSSPSLSTRVSPRDTQRIREELAALIQEELASELTAGGYTVVTEPGEDVLELRAQVINLYIQAPDLTTTASSRVYALSAGEMSLVADLRDSLTGETAMRVYDHAEAQETVHMRWITRSENRSEARAAAKGWARSLRQLLDQAKTVPAS
jgi:hypothetical protein